MGRLCGFCKHYVEGKAILGRLWKGSICMSKEEEPSKTIRVFNDKPITQTCWEPISREAAVWEMTSGY